MASYHIGNEAMIIHGASECVPGKQECRVHSLDAAKRSVVEQEKGRVHRQAAAAH
jgi:hypothetical protein